MALEQQYRCDCGCGAVRGAENHWFLLSIGTAGIWVGTWDAGEPAKCKHAAGSECVHKLLNAWMEKQREGK